MVAITSHHTLPAFQTFKGRRMNDRKSDGNCDTKLSRNRPERPDNGVKGVKEQGPSSGAWKQNPHKHQQLAQHAWVAS